MLFEESQPPAGDPPAYDDKTILRQEVETLGLLLSCHPLTLHRREIARLKPLPARDLHRWTGRYVTLIGWWVTGKTVQDKNGRPMEFVTFEDTSATYDATFFPNAYEKFCRILSRHQPYLLKGRVEMEFGVATLNVEWVGGVS
jgi:error-prone DNA polymerase